MPRLPLLRRNAIAISCGDPRPNSSFDRHGPGHRRYSPECSAAYGRNGGPGRGNHLRCSSPRNSEGEGTRRPCPGRPSSSRRAAPRRESAAALSCGDALNRPPARLALEPLVRLGSDRGLERGPGGHRRRGLGEAARGRALEVGTHGRIELPLPPQAMVSRPTRRGGRND
jgi:hypothetical protein